MADRRAFKKVLLAGFVVYVLGFAGLMRLIGDSFLLAIAAIVGWLMLLAGTLRYLGIRPKTQADK